MPKIFDRVGIRAPKYSSFDLAHEQKLSCKMGELVPTLVQEVLPGDQFKNNSEIMMRMAPMIAPVMHRVNVFIHFFFVPNRLIWNQWEEFITGGREGTSSPTFPTYTMEAPVRTSKLGDYLGLPETAVGNGSQTISALPFRAYQKIFLDYYRDPNLVAEFDVNTANATVLTTLRKRAWEKDYFTSALPWTQRGPAVGVPGDIEYMSQSIAYVANTQTPADGDLVALSSGPPGGVATTGGAASDVKIENIDEINIDINDLRRSSAIQRYLENNARGGSRYIEQILFRWNKKSSDQRLQRAEYIGGGKQPIIISEVLNTAGQVDPSTGDPVGLPQGDMAGHGISAGSSNTFKYEAEEHGYIMGIMSVLPRTAYQQGIERHWLRRDKLDYATPELANLGEQEILNKELYFDPTDDAYSNGTFGYQQRYAEYKYGVSKVHGDFRNTLNFWHLGRIFASQPNLNAAFMEADPSTRIFAVEEGDHLWVQIYHNLKARRALPFHADPRLT